MKKNQLIDSISMPSLHLEEKQLPEIKDWEVGEEYTLLLRVKQTSKSESQYEKEKHSNASFEIKSVKAVDKSAASKSFKDFESEYRK